MAERMKVAGRKSRIRRILKSAAVAEKGQLACIDTTDGALVAAAVATTLNAIGYFTESFTGNGTRVTEVQLFAELELEKLPASATGAPVDADITKVVYIRNDGVSTTSTGSSVLGRLWQVDSDGVWVQTVMAGGAAS